MAVRKVMRDVVSEKAVPLRITVEVPKKETVQITRQEASPPSPPAKDEIRIEIPDDKPRPAFLSPERRLERRANYPGGPMLATDTRPRRHTFLFVLGLIVVILAIAGIWATARAGATLTLSPRMQTASIDTSFHAYKSDVPVGGLKSTVLEIVADESITVPAGEKKHVERKATGKVTFYNSYSKDPVRLIANTRVKTAEGKVFRTNSVVTIPGYRTVSGKTEPGTLEATVTADVAGATYNIPPSDFTLPGLAGGAMFDKVTAKSLQAFTGGLAGDIRSIADADLATARTKLEGTLSEKLLADLQTKLPESSIFFPNAYSTKFELDEYGPAATAAAGVTDQTAEMQTVTLHGTLTAVLFDKRELATYLAKRELPAAADATLDINNWSDLKVDIADIENASSMEEIPVTISGNAQFVWQIDQAKLKEDLMGKPKSEYDQIFLGYPAIDRAQVRISPFWVKHFPQNPDRIDIEIKVS